MPFHIFLSQSLSLITGGLSAWKIAKDVITALLLAATVLLVVLTLKDQHSKKKFYRYGLFAGFYLLLHFLLWALNPGLYRQSALLGTVYNNRLLWYLLIGLGAALLWPKKVEQKRVLRIVIFVSTAVCFLGVLQYFLPKDLLTHFGYSITRGVKPNFFIDDKPDFPRIMSTLRDPNSLGAFLILPITVLMYKLFHGAKQRRNLVVGLLGLHGLALFLTFSRSAWLGTVISVAVLGAYELRTSLKPFLAKYWPLVIGVVLLVGSLTLTLRHQYVVQNIISHSDKSTSAKSQNDSNGYHWLFIKRGLEGIVRQPLGHGPGTAGLASIQNPKGGFLTENYYVQIGYEVGVLGLLAFIFIQVVLYKKLLQNKTPLAICLLASFWGYILVNMLLHIWSNEAVAAQWWLLAGLAIGLDKRSTKKSRTAIIVP